MIQIVNETFEANAKKNHRDIDQEVKVKWDPDGSFISESDRVLQVVIDRAAKIPISGVYSAEMTVVLENSDSRYISD